MKRRKSPVKHVPAVLILDFPPARAARVQRWVETAGFAAIRVGRWSQALEILDRQRIDILIVSLVPAPEEAAELLKRLRRRPASRAAALFLVVGKKERGLARWGHVADCAQGLVREPLVKEELIFQLRPFRRDPARRLFRKGPCEGGLLRNGGDEFEASVGPFSGPVVSPTANIELASEIFLEEALRLTASPHGYVATIDPANGNLLGHAMAGIANQKGGPQGLGSHVVLSPNAHGQYPGLWGQALNTRLPCCWNHLSGTQPSTGALASCPVPAGRMLAVPVLLGCELAGQILVANAPRDYRPRSVAVLRRLAEHFACAIQRIRFRQALRAERDFVEAVLGTAGALVVVTDIQGRIVRFNKACEQISGLRFEEVSGKVFWDFFLLPEEIARVKAVVDQLIAGHYPNHCENYWVARDGRRHRIFWSNTVLLDDRKQVQYVIGTGVDVTRHREAEEKLRVLTRAMEAGPSSVIITDGRGIITYVNPTFAHQTGYTPEEVLGQTPRLWKSGIHTPEFYGGLWDTLSKGREWRGELCNRKKNGELFWIYSTISPILDDAGEIRNIVAVTLDITQRKRFEQMLETVQEELHRKVAERTADLSSTIQALHTEIEARRRAEKEIQELLQFERMVTEISTVFAGLQPGQFEEAIRECIKRIKIFLRADHAALGEFAESDLICAIQCQDPGWQCLPGRFAASEFPWLLNELRQTRRVCISNERQLPANAETDRGSYARRGLKGLLALPLDIRGETIGTLLFASIQEDHAWPRETLHRMQLVEDLFAGLLMRWRSEKALSEAERRYHAVADFMRDWDYWESPEGLLLFCSPACERITGYGPERFLADPTLLGEIVLPEDAALWREHLCRGGDTAARRNLKFRIRRADGQVRWIDHTCRQVLDGSGRSLGIRASNRDNTATRLAELETERLREELARVARVTVLDHLAASLAHELRQPLAAILSNAEAAVRFLELNPPDLAEVREALGDIIQNDERAGEVIRRLRALYRRGGQERVALDINKLIEETLPLLRGELILRRVVCTHELAAGMPMVLGNRIELQQVLLNLILNGMEAMAGLDPKDRRLAIATAADPAGGVRVSVSDAGEGIHPEGAERLFEPFFTTKETGMGMGLVISRTIVESHKGRLWAEANPGAGATFCFTLPNEETAV